MSAARRFVRDTLGDLPGETVDSIELMVSELASNCVRHARSDFEVLIETSPTGIRVATRDTGTGDPTPRSPTPLEPTGRGLRIVEAMSDSWGVTPDTSGKTVWFTVSRQRARSSKEAPTAAHDHLGKSSLAALRRPQRGNATEFSASAFSDASFSRRWPDLRLSLVVG